MRHRDLVLVLGTALQSPLRLKFIFEILTTSALSAVLNRKLWLRVQTVHLCSLLANRVADCTLGDRDYGSELYLRVLWEFLAQLLLLLFEFLLSLINNIVDLRFSLISRSHIACWYCILKIKLISGILITHRLHQQRAFRPRFLILKITRLIQSLIMWFQDGFTSMRLHDFYFILIEIRHGVRWWFH